MMYLILMRSCRGQNLNMKPKALVGRPLSVEGRLVSGYLFQGPC